MALVTRSTLKAASPEDDIVGVTSCPTCALPSSSVRPTCAWCGAAALLSPVLARLTTYAHDWSLTTGCRTLAEGTLDGEFWRVRTVGGRDHSLVTVRSGSVVEFVVFDDELNAVASLGLMGSATTSAVVLRDAREQVTGVVRADGSGGLHATAPDGAVLFFAGHSRGGTGLDLLITDHGLRLSLLTVFSLLVALEAERLGPLHALR